MTADGALRTASDRGRWWLVLLIGLVFAGSIGVLVWRPWDPRVSEAQAREAVAAEFAPGGSRVRCERSEQEGDGSLPGLGEVDYECRVGGEGSARPRDGVPAR
ncbi:MAG: hypothetical protein ACXWWQ_06485 [Candidatus Limnocylindria bacterium]